MIEWQPITQLKLLDKIQKTETKLNGQVWNFWQLIQIDPAKWSEPTHGLDHGFWVLAICGRKIIWYNDIEEGFNISDYKIQGEIIGYYCNQDELNEAVIRLFDLVIFGGEVIGQASPPIP